MQTINNYSLFLLSINRFCYDVRKVISKKYQLSVNERNTLLVLTNLKINSVTELSGYLSISKTNTSKVLSSLEKKNLILRLFDKKDKRIIQLLLTEKGKLISNKVVEELSILLDKRLSDFSNDTSEKIKSLIKNYPTLSKQSSIKTNS